MDLKKRIKKNEEFQQIINLRKIIGSKGFTIFYRKIDSDNYRYGISVSKKVGNAVIRNRSKRRIKGILKDIELKNKNIEFIIIIKKDIIEMTYIELKNDLIRSISKI